MQHILIVDDEPNIASALSLLLQQANYKTTVADNGKAALQALNDDSIDLVLLDLELGTPVDGLAVCQEIRGLTNSIGYIPIIILTVRSSDEDKVIGLGFGADDYIAKPFNERELLARIRATLRTFTAGSKNLLFATLKIDEHLQIDPERRKVFKDEQELELSYREFDLLLFLARNAGRPWGKQTLLDRVWGEDYIVEEGTVTRHISSLRSKLETDPSNPYYILTERGFGYRFREW